MTAQLLDESITVMVGVLVALVGFNRIHVPSHLLSPALRRLARWAGLIMILAGTVVILSTIIRDPRP